MKRILAIIAAFIIPVTASAQVTRQQAEDQLIGLGMPGLQADLVAGLGTGLGVVSNNEYQTARNAAGTANINVWKVDSGDNTVINSSASDELRLQLEDDAQRLVSFLGTSDVLNAITWGDGGTTAVQGLDIRASTADADDDSTLQLCGGGACLNGGRGASITLPGEEVAGGSDITYNTGASDTHIFAVSGTTSLTLGTNAAFVGQFTSAATSDLGWALVSAANQACNTTCTFACVMGQETTSKAFLACTDATADICLCAGAS